ncbi:MAG: hypothetical protein JO013_00630 [Alphaproteobacteria bacterium]|nr:hypothetical protein [Alphaproteobacteria bacterium]
MIYSIEEYYKNLFAKLDRAGLDALLSRDRVAMAMILASGSHGKAEVAFADFLAMARLAEKFGCLDVYVNFYGRPVSYVIWGTCDRPPPAADPEVRFGGASGDLYLVDFAVREGSLDATVDLWLSERTEHSITVRRSDRAKQYRTYPVSRIRSFPWRVSTISGRFSAEKGPGLPEFEAIVRTGVDTYRIVQSVLEAIGHDGQVRAEITKSVPLLYELLDLQQLHVALEDGACTAALAVALSEAPAWRQRTATDVLALPFRSFVDGPDLVLVELCGHDLSLEGLRAPLLRALAQEGETQLTVRALSSPDASRRAWDRACPDHWRATPSANDGLISLVRA